MPSIDRVDMSAELAIEQKDRARLQAAFARVEEVIVSSLDWDKVLDVLSKEVLLAGIFRSLTVGVVNWDDRYVEIARNYLCIDEEGEIKPAPTIAESPNEIVARGGRIVETRPLIGRRVSFDQPDKMVLAALRKKVQVFGFITDNGDDRWVKMGYFIPVMFGDKVAAVIATGSETKDQDAVMQRIELLAPLLKQVALALEHARIYKALQERNREMEERDHLLAALQKFERAMLASLNRDEILDNLTREIAAIGIFESLMVALVDRKRHQVEVVRSFVCRMEDGRSVPILSPSEAIGLSYDLDDNNITAVVARTGVMEVVEEWDDRFDTRIDSPVSRRGRAAFFVPVKKGEETVAVMATASSLEEKETLLRRIDVMQPLLDQIAQALERARLYEQLAAERERLAVTLGSIGDGVIATDQLGQVTLMNDLAESIAEWNDGNAEGQHLLDVLGGGEDRRRVTSELLVAALQGQALAARQIEISAADGKISLVRIHAAPIRVGEGGIGGAVFVLHDITQQQRLEDEANRMRHIESLGVLAGGIAHDFNNILASALINVSLLKMQNSDEVEGKIIADIEISMQRARDLTQQLMTFTKGSAPIKEASSLAELVRATATFVLRGSGVKCSFEIAEDLWPVNIDPTQISQVIENLIINANQAMQGGGDLWVRVENVQITAADILPLPVGQYIRCSVVDTGRGISREHLGQIFDPYFTTKEEGTGLGLASAFAIISHHEGWMTADSTEGEGAQFDFYLPASKESVCESVQRESAPHGRGRVLLMDDDENLRAAAERALGHLGYELTTVADGREAIALYKKQLEAGNSFDVVVLDLTIPGGMGGEKAARELLALDAEARLVVSSGHTASPILTNCRDYGFKDRVVKPYTMDELGQVISRILS